MRKPLVQQHAIFIGELQLFMVFCVHFWTFFPQFIQIFQTFPNFSHCFFQIFLIFPRFFPICLRLFPFSSGVSHIFTPQKPPGMTGDRPSPVSVAGSGAWWSGFRRRAKASGLQEPGWQQARSYRSDRRYLQVADWFNMGMGQYL